MVAKAHRPPPRGSVVRRPVVPDTIVVAVRRPIGRTVRWLIGRSVGDMVADSIAGVVAHRVGHLVNRIGGQVPGRVTFPVSFPLTVTFPVTILFPLTIADLVGDAILGPVVSPQGDHLGPAATNEVTVGVDCSDDVAVAVADAHVVVARGGLIEAGPGDDVAFAAIHAAPEVVADRRLDVGLGPLTADGDDGIDEHSLVGAGVELHPMGGTLESKQFELTISFM